MSTKLYFSVIPNAQTTCVLNVEEEEIKIYINQPPENNKANKELIRYLSKILKINKKDICIISGHSGKHKTVVVNGKPDCMDILRNVIH